MHATRLGAWAALAAVCVVFCVLREMPAWVAHGLLLVFLAACLAPTLTGSSAELTGSSAARPTASSYRTR
jgi:hypothetical protein